MASFYGGLLLASVWMLLVSGYRAASPLILWLLAWSLAFIAVGVLAGDFRYPEYTESLIFFYVSAFAVCCALSGGLYRGTAQHREFSGGRWLKGFTRITLICGALSLVVMAQSLNVNLASIVDIRSLGKLAQENQVALYSSWSLTEDNIPFASKLLNAVFQSGFIVYFFCLGAGWKPKGTMKLYPIIAIFIAVSFSSITTVRIFLLVPVIWSLSAFMAGTAYAGREAILVRPKVIFATLSIAVLLVGSVVLFQTFRLGDRSYGLQYTLNHLRPWAAGYIPAFGLWVDGEGGTPMYGQLLLRGILGPLGLSEGEGITERASLLPLGNGQTTNASTFFRVPVTDWGPYGAVLQIMILGVLAGACYRSAKRGSARAGVLLVAVIAAVLWSPNYWYLAYGSRLMGLAIVFLVLPTILRTAPRKKPNTKKQGIQRNTVAYRPVRIDPAEQEKIDELAAALANAANQVWAGKTGRAH